MRSYARAKGLATIFPRSRPVFCPGSGGKVRAECERATYNSCMKLPRLEKPDRYEGLYVFDFGDHTGVGFTAEEVAELLDSERYKDGKVYRIQRALPDGQMELRGVPAAAFQLEAGMFFHSDDEATARGDFKRLVNLAVQSAPPCRAKVQLAKYAADQFVVAIIYPAERDADVSTWLLEGDYRTAGAAEGGTEAVERYYRSRPEILEIHQLFGAGETISRTGQELLESVPLAVQR
jgi:hypothetical protein